MKKLIGLLILVPALAPADNRVDNRAAIEALQYEPASLLDIAMLRLQDFIVWTQPNMVGEYNLAAQGEIRHLDINAYYVPEEAVIKYSVSLRDTQPGDKRKRDGCERIMEITQINLLKSLPGLFVHDDRSWPPGLDGSAFKLANLIELSCIVYGNSSDEVYVRTGRPLASAHKAAHGN